LPKMVKPTSRLSCGKWKKLLGWRLLTRGEELIWRAAEFKLCRAKSRRTHRAARNLKQTVIKTTQRIFFHIAKEIARHKILLPD
jgi:hypothetical protein